jgi:hypothetical protein
MLSKTQIASFIKRVGVALRQKLILGGTSKPSSCNCCGSDYRICIYFKPKYSSCIITFFKMFIPYRIIYKYNSFENHFAKVYQ